MESKLSFYQNFRLFAPNFCFCFIIPSFIYFILLKTMSSGKNLKQVKKSKPKSHSKSLKNKIRDAERLLKKQGVNVAVRQTQERLLSALKSQLKTLERSNQEKKWMQKYKMVQFFEKQKL
eukprot:Sdes_comp19160_c0_seq1m9927